MRGRAGEKMPLITVHIPKQMVEALNELVRRGLYSSRSEVIRVAIAEFLQKVYTPKRDKDDEFDIPLLRGRW